MPRARDQHTCGVCGHRFSDIKGKPRKYCSKQCSGAARRERSRETRRCESCRKLFKCLKSQSTQYCSTACQKAGATHRAAERHRPPTTLIGVDLLNYAPQSAACVSTYIRRLDDGQMDSAWVPIMAEHFGAGLRAPMLSAMCEVRRKYRQRITVLETELTERTRSHQMDTHHGRDRTSTRCDADPNRAA